MQWTPEEIKRRRIAAGFKHQKDLAKRIGMSVRAISKWETGVSEPYGHNLRKLEEALGTVEDTDQDRLLREIDDGRFWAEATRRFFRKTETTQSAPSGGAQHDRGQHGTPPEELLRPQADKPVRLDDRGKPSEG